MSDPRDYVGDQDGVDEMARKLQGIGDAADTADERALADFLAEMRGLADGPAPQPSDQLAAMLGGAIPIGSARSRRVPIRLRWVGAGAAAFALGVTSLAAAHTLPSSAQRFVSNVVNGITPFHIDGGDGGGPLHRVPSTPPSSPSTEPSDDHGSHGPGTDDHGGSSSSGTDDDGGSNSGSGGGDDGSSSSGTDDHGGSTSGSGGGDDGSGSGSGSTSDDGTDSGGHSSGSGSGSGSSESPDDGSSSSKSSGSGGGDSERSGSSDDGHSGSGG